MGFLLFILSNLLGLLLLPLGIIWGLISEFHGHRWRSGLRDADAKFLKLATAIDKYGNIVCAELFNTLLIKSCSLYKFGNPTDTISKVIGMNIFLGTLSWEGKLLNRVLDYFDPGHSTKAAFGQKPDKS